MRAVVVTEHGGPDVLTLGEVADPTPGAGDLLVRVTAAGINFIDVYQRTGVYPTEPPYVPGVEGVDVVEAVGGVDAGRSDPADVTQTTAAGISPGQRVGWIAAGQGSFAELAVIPAARAIPIPDDIDDVTAVALLMQGITAQFLCTSTYPVSSGDVVLVHACAGGVGQMLTQMCAAAGATVIGTASSPAKADLALSLGAAHVLDYDDFASGVRELTGGAGVDVVFDGVGAATADGSLASVRRRGMVAFYGNASGTVPPIDPLRLTAAGSIFLARPTVVDYTVTTEELRARAGDVFARFSSGTLTVPAPTQYAMADVQDAYRALESRSTTGKLVLRW